ncbi:interactor of constitutive active ROPs 4-like isoform X2 [Aristolochia californica]|uniref:interactor of constitutive active ROPs 4-like isoform X2 n=1 Tax=Aristolochia californica TaxID=171875 RepID=UPI0035E34040
MPRSRGSEMPQRQSPRAPLQLRTSSSESDGHHPANRATVDRSPKLGDRRSPRAPVTEKKRGTRIADLQSQLGQTQEELKKVKEQLALSEAAKKEAQQELEKSRLQTLTQNPPEPQVSREKTVDATVTKSPEENSNEESSPETDVFEVPLLTMPADPKPEPVLTMPAATKPEPVLTMPAAPKPESVPASTLEQEKRESTDATKPSQESLAPEKPMTMPENAELSELKAKLAAKEKESESLDSENEDLKRQVSEAAAEASAARAEAEEATLKLTRMGEELDEAKGKVARTKADLEVVEVAKAGVEAEMRRLRVQTEQWRKAADAAAAVLAAGVDMNDGRRMAERCGSMDKHLGGSDADKYAGLGSPMMGDDMDDGFGSGKRKGAGIRMFGDLWKKKGQK